MPRAAEPARYPRCRALGRIIRAQFYASRGLPARDGAARERGHGPRTAELARYKFAARPRVGPGDSHV